MKKNKILLLIFFANSSFADHCRFQGVHQWFREATHIHQVRIYSYLGEDNVMLWAFEMAVKEVNNELGYSLFSYVVRETIEPCENFWRSEICYGYPDNIKAIAATDPNFKLFWPLSEFSNNTFLSHDILLNPKVLLKIINWIQEIYRPFDETAILIFLGEIIKHELLHVAGFKHYISPDKYSIMAPEYKSPLIFNFNEDVLTKEEAFKYLQKLYSKDTLEFSKIDPEQLNNWKCYAKHKKNAKNIKR